MAIPRSRIVDPEQPGVYHCISRCVRRAHLCGGAAKHRRWWIRRRLRTLTRIFAIDALSYAVMDNHLHSVLWTDPERVRTWSDQEVADRWLRLFPPPEGVTVSERRAQLLADPPLLKVLRRRLCDLGWFHKALKEPLARIANREDGVTGAFWEGRFKCIRVLDDQGVLTTCIYNDLNLIRAGLAETPETSELTGVWERIRWRDIVSRLQRLRRQCSLRVDRGARGVERPSRGPSLARPVRSAGGWNREPAANAPSASASTPTSRWSIRLADWFVQTSVAPSPQKFRQSSSDLACSCRPWSRRLALRGCGEQQLVVRRLWPPRQRVGARPE